MKTRLLISVILMTFAAPEIEAQEAVFIIRHAEKQASGEDPGLTEEGRSRATAWAEMLSQAGVAHVITTDARRTQETGTIIAGLLGVTQSQVGMTDVAGLIDLLSFDYADGRVLVVGHRETIPAIVADLGSFDEVAIESGDYANLFVLTSRGGEGVLLTRLRMP